MAFWFASLVLAASIISHVSTAKTDHFEFNSNLTCNYLDREFWHYTIRYMEQDSHSNHDVIVGPWTYTISAEDHFLKLEADHDGDEIDETSKPVYEVYAEIRHTCTSDKKESSLILNFDAKCGVYTGGICKYDYERNITDFWGIQNQKVRLNYENKSTKKLM